MSLSAALEIGKQGLRNYQIAAEVTSENIANVNTPGYSRQRVILETAPPTTHNGFPLGSGVQIATVERYYDALLQKQLVNSETVSSYNSKNSEVLKQVEPVFNEIAQDGLGAALSDYFNSWQDLSLNPTGGAERQAVLDKGQILADQVNYAAKTLSGAMVTQNESISPLVSDINRIVDNIARLNGQIELTELVSGNANEMRDQRDYLVRQLAQNMAVSFTENSDGSTDISYTDTTGTYALVTGSTSGSLSTTTSGTLPDGTARILVQLTAADGTGPTTIAPVTGELGSVMVTRDTTLNNYLNQIKTLADTLSTAVNNQHQLGRDLNGDLGAPFYVYDAATPSALLKVNTADLSSTAKIAAATVFPVLKGDNTNAVAMAQLAKTNYAALSDSTFNNYYNGLVAQVGLDVQTADNVVSQDASFMKQLTTLRDSNSGVSLDEELTDLIKYQRSYQASAKLITTVNDMMEVLVNMLR